MMGMNYINVYSPINGSGYTICCGNKMDNLSDVLSLPKAERKYMFADVRAYSFGFAVLKYDITEKDFQLGKEHTPTIMVFDWNGNELVEIIPGTNFNHFDIDANNKLLYILNSNGDITRYNISMAKLPTHD